MRHETKLLNLVETLGYTKPKDLDTHTFMCRKVFRLWERSKEFRDFLTQHTSFLPSTVEPIHRWYYFRDSVTKPRLCPVCTAFITSYTDKYCSHACSTKESLGAKRGPKVDLSKLERDLRVALKSKPKYQLVSFGHKRSTFKHTCGAKFEASNYAILTGRNTCPCQHKKLSKHTLQTLQQWHKQHATGWNPIRYVEGSDAALLEGKCGHRLKTRKFYDRKCPKCNPNIFASNVVTHADYVRSLKKLRPELKVLGTYVNVRTSVRYLHTRCGQEFEAKPQTVKRRAFRCPACAPKTCGSYRKFVRNGIELHVRGKEGVALSWILDNTRITLDDLVVASEGTVPKITYPAPEGHVQTYRPDFYVACRNLIIEVKDCRTLGLGDKGFFYVLPERLWHTNCAKAKACLDQGYRFNMLVFNTHNERIVLPKSWHTYSHARILKWVKQNKIAV